MWDEAAVRRFDRKVAWIDRQAESIVNALIQDADISRGELRSGHRRAFRPDRTELRGRGAPAKGAIRRSVPPGGRGPVPQLPQIPQIGLMIAKTLFLM
jgi:hypothetical protein